MKYIVFLFFMYKWSVVEGLVKLEEGKVGVCFGWFFWFVKL